MSINNCFIHDNNIYNTLIKIIGDFNLFEMINTNITNNLNNKTGSILSMKSVLLSYININNNYASQYGVFTGDLSGDLKIEHSNIINNESPYGSCIYAYGSSLILSNNIII